MKIIEIAAHIPITRGLKNWRSLEARDTKEAPPRTEGVVPLPEAR